MAEKEIIVHETFLNEVLRQNLNKVREEREKLHQEVLDLEALKTEVHLLMEAELTKETITKHVDLGCNFYVQANVTEPNYIFINVGLDIFVQYTFEEALKFLDKKIKFYKLKIEKTLKESAEIQAQIQVGLLDLKERCNLTYVESQPRYEVL